MFNLTYTLHSVPISERLNLQITETRYYPDIGIANFTNPTRGIETLVCNYYLINPRSE